MEKLVCLVSGGIDSPVACVLMAEKFEVIPLHFYLYPYTSKETFFVVMKILKKLKEKAKFEKFIIYPWSKILRTILESGENRSYVCLACRKSMFRVAEIICEREGAGALVTGESLGQKATQTLLNMRATSSGIKFPIIRPLLGLDKPEIEHLSKKFGIWQELHASCCYATPKHPRTRADPKVLDELLSKLRIDEAIHKEFENVLEVRTFEEDLEDYLKTLT